MSTNRLPTQEVKDIYIAGPFFNSVQIEIIERIESILTSNGFSYYSPRLDSGSHLLTAEQKKVRKNWDHIFESNIQALHRCKAGIFCLGYPHPWPLALHVTRPFSEEECAELIARMNAPQYGKPILLAKDATIARIGREVELPDSGTVFEMGYMCALKKPRIGFHPDNTPDKLNLMLTHGLDGIVLGWENLSQFLSFEVSFSLYCVDYENAVKHYIDWSACEQFEKEVE